MSGLSVTLMIRVRFICYSEDLCPVGLLLYGFVSEFFILLFCIRIFCYSTHLCLVVFLFYRFVSGLFVNLLICVWFVCNSTDFCLVFCYSTHLCLVYLLF